MQTTFKRVRAKPGDAAWPGAGAQGCLDISSRGAQG